MKEIDADELKRKLELGEPVAVVDIREASEYVDWHIHNSISFPVYSALKAGNVGAVSTRVDTLPDDRPLVVVCNRGNTSKLAASILESGGFEAYSLIGGMRGWSTVWSEARLVQTGKGCTAIIQVRRNGKGCLSYMFGSNGEAAVVDPCVDGSVYVKIAEREDLRITHVFDTHVHADHISRGQSLARATGARYFLPANERVTYSFSPLYDKDRLDFRQAMMESVVTPGHTEESTCYLINGETLLTGDTLFVESVGRPDLEKGDAGADAGARMLYKSLHEKLLALSRNVQVLPGHYSKPLGFDGVPVAASLGELIPKLEMLSLDEQAFVRTVLSNLGLKPPNFHAVIAVNEGRLNSAEIDTLDIEAGPNRCAIR